MKYFGVKNMREIKFRGKRLDDGKWITGSYLHMKMCSTFTKVIDRHYIVTETGRAEINPNTVGQFAELKDIDETELYEDDIICDLGGYYYAKFDLIGGLKFYNARGYYVMPIRPIFQKQVFKIVGNMHDNKELLNC